MPDTLVIGTQGLAHKDEMVLKALVRLLEGGINLRARFSEQLDACNVVFVPGSGPAAALPASCLAVRVREQVQEADACPGELAVAAPLRMTNVIAVLQSAAQRLHGAVRYDTVQGLLSLFTLLGESTRTAERRRAVVPMSSGQQIVFDFTRQLVHTAMPMETLLSGAYTLGTPHRVSPVEEALIRSVPTHSLRHLLWKLSLRLAQAGAAAPPRAGCYRLRRWPDAVGLVAPGHPRLAALWTQRALSLEQIDAASGVPPAAARWFLEACLALGLAAEEARGGLAGAVAAVAGAATPPAARAAAPGWLGHLRERLKLW